MNNIILLLPFTALLRPILAITRTDSLRRALVAFSVTLQKAGHIFVVFGLLLVIATVQGVTLFYNVSEHMGIDGIDEHQEDQQHRYVNNRRHLQHLSFRDCH